MQSLTGNVLLTERLSSPTIKGTQLRVPLKSPGTLFPRCSRVLSREGRGGSLIFASMMPRDAKLPNSLTVTEITRGQARDDNIGVYYLHICIYYE